MRNKAPAPNRRPRFPLGGSEEFGYYICAPPSSSAAVGEAQRSPPHTYGCLLAIRVSKADTGVRTSRSGRACSAVHQGQGHVELFLLSQMISNPPTQAQVQAIQNKINELINAITRPVP